MPLAPGIHLGPYEISTPLGAGGMGEVYRARDMRLERTVAIKVLPASLAENSQARERFEREARAVSKLNHPHICTLYDVGDEGSTHFLVMEYLEGETLAHRIGRGALPLDVAVKFAHQMADALAKAHRAGIVHRDLKPDNVFLTKQGVKLLDFGLAKDRTAASSVGDGTKSGSATILADTATAAGTILGTYPYMSPEQLEGKPADSRSDIFALGTTLYEMLTGHRAFEGKSQASVIAAILEREPRSISEMLPLCPQSLDHLVRRCLAKDPEERWQSAFDLKLEIEAIAGDAGHGEGKQTAAKPLRGPARLPWTIAALAILAALASGLLFSRKEVSSVAIYSSLVAPAGTTFQIEGDLGAPPALAPDGSALVFGAGDELWYRSLRDGSDRVLSGANGAIHSYPFWSPDSRSIGFFSDGKLKILDVGGGTAKTLCDAPNPRGGSWGTSGVIIFTPTSRDVIYQVPATGGTPTQVSRMDVKLHTTHRWPYFLPDGKHFLYLATNHVLPQGEQNGIYVASLDGSVNRSLVSSLAGAAYASGNLFFVKEARLLAQSFDLRNLTLSGTPHAMAEGVVVDLAVWHATFTISNADSLVFQTGVAMGMARLEWMDRSGKHLGFASEKGTFFSPRLSKDGKRILVATGDPSHDVWLFDSTGQKKTRLTFDSLSTSEAVWSPDETQFAYGLGQPGKKFTIKIKGASGSGPAKLLEESGDINSPTDWSPDGRYLLSERFENGTHLLWLIPLNGGQPSQALNPSYVPKGMQSSGQFSPDGKWVAFELATSGGPQQTYIMPFPSGSGMWQASVESGRWPRWRRDGRELYFVSDKNEMTAVEVRAKGEGLELGRPTPLFSFRPSLRIFRQGMIGYDVTPDGKKFLINAAADENTRPLTLVVNWDAELKKK